MWLRLGQRYILSKTEKTDTHLRWGKKRIIAIREGAPVKISLHDIQGPTFIVCSTRYPNKLFDLTFEDFQLPSSCLIDIEPAFPNKNEGIILCVTEKSFIKVTPKEWLRAQLKYCPLCGCKLEAFPPFLPEERIEMYEEKVK